MSEAKARQLLDPADKQNVPKAVTLLQTICGLHKFSLNLLLPSEQVDLRRFHFLGEVLSSFLLPFVDLSVSLDQQIISLVKYAHLICACWTRHRNSFMSGALYTDSQVIIKNIIFLLAKQQVLNETKDFYIILNGTDCLEQVFSNAQTQDHSRNFDMLQLSQKLATASTINNIFLQNPGLDCGHTQLSLAGASSVDHVNPKSCTGNLVSGSVNIQASWVHGQKEANLILKHYFGEDAAIEFNQLFSDPTKDLLRPSGKYVGTAASDSTAQYYNGSPNPSSNIHTSTHWTQIAAMGRVLVMLLPALPTSRLKTPSLPNQPIQTLPSTHFLLSADGKEYYKGSILSSYLCGGHRAKKVVE